MNIKLALKQVLDSVQQFREYVEYKKIEKDPGFAKFMQQLNYDMCKYATQLKTIKSDQIKLHKYYNNHLGELVRIHDTVRGGFANRFLTKLERLTFMKCYDSIYFKIFDQRKFGSDIAILPTQYFTEFIKGITYFQDEDVTNAHPVYHRSISCGTKAMTAKNKFSQGKDKTYLRKCYIERHIYNRVYTRIIEAQNTQHMNELAAVERYYEEFFPNEYIKVDVKFTNFIHPSKLIITWQNKQYEYFTEIYEKTYDVDTGVYSDTVVCKRMSRNSNRTLHYEKTQMFDLEIPWMQLL